MTDFPRRQRRPIVQCEKCHARYDDASCWTICPHNPLHVSPHKVLCREHDLFDCPFHDPGVPSKTNLNDPSADLVKVDFPTPGMALRQTKLFGRKPLKRRMTRGDFIQETLSIWDGTLVIVPELKDEHTIAVEWLTKTYLTEELNEPRPAWWKFWHKDRETFREAWDETMLLLAMLRGRLHL